MVRYAFKRDKGRWVIKVRRLGEESTEPDSSLVPPPLAAAVIRAVECDITGQGVLPMTDPIYKGRDMAWWDALEAVAELDTEAILDAIPALIAATEGEPVPNTFVVPEGPVANAMRAVAGAGTGEVVRGALVVDDEGKLALELVCVGVKSKS